MGTCWYLWSGEMPLVTTAFVVVVVPVVVVRLFFLHFFPRPKHKQARIKPRAQRAINPKITRFRLDQPRTKEPKANWMKQPDGEKPKKIFGSSSFVLRRANHHSEERFPRLPEKVNDGGVWSGDRCCLYNSDDKEGRRHVAITLLLGTLPSSSQATDQRMSMKCRFSRFSLSLSLSLSRSSWIHPGFDVNWKVNWWSDFVHWPCDWHFGCWKFLSLLFIGYCLPRLIHSSEMCKQTCQRRPWIRRHTHTVLVALLPLLSITSYLHLCKQRRSRTHRHT